jgi:ketosteroid isomerase-like protein
MSSPANDRHQVLALAKREADVIASGDVEGYLDLLADDAVFLPPNTHARTDGELREWLREFLQTSSVEWLEYIDGVTMVSGDLAFHDYAYVWRVTPKAGGQPILGRGKGMQVFCRLPSGSWRLLRNVWNANPA